MSGADPWESHRRLRDQLIFRMAIWFVLMGLPLTFPGIPILGAYWWIPAPLLLAWVGLAVWRFNTWPCPRCHARYLMRGSFYGNSFARHCLNCGLKKYDSAS